MNMEQHKFFLYARKSTDVEDKQIRSIEDQIAELRAFAKQENLNIVDVLIEKQSAKIPGRPIFGEMLERVESGEADGILAWHADRLARNSVDGGRIIYVEHCIWAKQILCGFSFRKHEAWFAPKSETR